MSKEAGDLKASQTVPEKGAIFIWGVRDERNMRLNREKYCIVLYNEKCVWGGTEKGAIKGNHKQGVRQHNTKALRVKEERLKTRAMQVDVKGSEKIP